MKVVVANCPACGGKYDGDIRGGVMTCAYCGAKFALESDELEAFGLNRSGGAVADSSDDYEEEAYEDLQPMTDFARDACDEFLNSVDDSEFECTDKIVDGLGIGDEDEIILIHDDTLFKSGKNGFAITDYGFYCREMGDSEAHFLYWNDFADAEQPESDDSYIKVGDVSVAYYTGSSDTRSELRKLFRKLHDHATKFDWSFE